MKWRCTIDLDVPYSSGAFDVAFIHVHESDCYGNCRIKGITVAGLDLLLVK